MNIKFKKIYIENFMSIGNAPLELEDRGFTLIEGVNNNQADNARSNGSGKSSLFEALVWCLTGNTIRGNKDVVNFNGDDGAYVQLTFEVDGKEFVITRTKNYSKYKTNLFISIDGVDKSGKGIRDTEKLLSEYLPDLTPSLIGSVIVLGQGLPQKFTNNTPSGRKEVLEKLFKSDYMIQDLKDRISARRTELNEAIRRVQDERLVNSTKISTLEERINVDRSRWMRLRDMTTLESDVEALQDDIDRLSQKRDLITAEFSDLSAQREKKLECLTNCKLQQAEVSSQIDLEYKDTIEFTKAHINDATVRLRLAKAELDKAKSIKEVCPTCGQKLPDVHKPDIATYEDSVNEASQNLSHWNAQLRKIEDEMEGKKHSKSVELIYQTEELTRASLTLYDDAQALLREVDTISVELEAKKKVLDEKTLLEKNRLFEMESLIKTIEDSQIALDSLTTKNETLDGEESVLSDRLGIQNKFNTAISRDFRGYLLNDIIVYINSRAKEYCREMFNTELIEFTLDGNNLLISYNGKEYEALSGGERQKIDLIVQFAIRDMLCKHTGFSSNILVMDEIFDNLDDVGSQKVIDLILSKLCDISSIFIITHHGNELGIPCDNLIKSEKDDTGITRLCN